ncbi:MAG: HlyC/CorC family transporter [Lentisphaeria bacterium]|nr:HlyC/CorC family transporter [Lentisphaeria bacterium]
MNLVLFIVCSVLYLWITAAFEAFSSLTGGRILKVAERDRKFAERLEGWHDREESIRAVLKLILCILAAFAGVLATEWTGAVAPEFAHRWGWLVIMAAVTILTVISELVARLVLLRFDLAVLKFTIPIVASRFFRPLATLIEKVTTAGDDWHRADAPDELASAEDEIMSLVDGADEDGADGLEEEEKKMIRGILELGGMKVREIMTPRVDLEAIPASASVAEAKKVFVTSGHSRIPVYGANLDDVKGILYAKDFIDEHSLEGRTLAELARPPIFIPETKDVSDLLRQIKRTSNHFAVIIDEYGGTSGVVTFEDIIEEIVGEIHDEYDTEEDFEEQPVCLEDGSVILDARTPVDDVNTLAGTGIDDSEEADTIGGYICAMFGRIPRAGETYEEPGKYRATILEADSRTVRKLKLERIPEEEGDTTDAE